MRLLDLWDRLDKTAKSLVIAGLKVVASDSCNGSRDAKDGQPLVWASILISVHHYDEGLSSSTPLA